MTDVQREIIKGLCDNGMSPSKAAKNLHYHRTNIWYHIYRIRENTGLDPTNFYDLIKLKEIADNV